MSVRIDSIILTPNSLMLPMALAFFLVLGSQELRRVLRSVGHVRGLLAVAACCGILGGWGYAVLAGNGDSDGLPTAFDFRFGSFGGFWGVLLGGGAYAIATRHSALAVTDALVVAVLSGAAVARLGCLFTGCCTGILVTGASVQYLRPWPAYDIAALLATLWMATRARVRKAPGGGTAAFLTMYGALRFLLEFARELRPVAGLLTLNQFPAAAQCVVGLVLLIVMCGRREHETDGA